MPQPVSGFSKKTKEEKELAFFASKNTRIFLHKLTAYKIKHVVVLLKKEGETKKQKKQAHDDEKKQKSIVKKSQRREKFVLFCTPQKNNTPFLE